MITGPNTVLLPPYVEVDANEDLLKSHDIIDNIERDIEIDHGIHLVIHLDPIVTDDPYVQEMRQITEKDWLQILTVRFRSMTSGLWEGFDP